MKTRPCKVAIAAWTLCLLLLAGCDDRKPAGAGAGGPPATEWTCSMHPQIRQPAPGNCPICGMRLVPAEAANNKPVTTAKKKKYACSMFCIPPLDDPGQCPVCGMEMVAVEEGEGAGGDATPEPEVFLSAASRQTGQIATAAVERRFVEKEIRLKGKIDFDETKTSVISARVPGRLDKLFVDYTGISVAKGDHLVQLYSPTLVNAQEELLQAARGIKEAGPIGIPAFREAAEGNLRSTREKLALWGLTPEQIEEIEQRGTPSDHITIHATQSGVVIEKNAVEGMYVEMGMKIYTIADLSQLWARLDAYETDLPWIRYGQSVEIETQAYPGEVFTGVISFVDPVVDDRTRSVKLRTNLPNPDGRLKPNMFVRATLRSKLAAGGKLMEPSMAGKWICPMHPEVVRDRSMPCPECGMDLKKAEDLGFTTVGSPPADAPLVIPVSAPLLTGTRAIVYVEKPEQPGSFIGRQITLGPRAGDFYLVEHGLSEGERVVVNGSFFVDSAMQIFGRTSMMNVQKESDKPKGTEVHGGH
jgi:membrane fusion protein, copper/silver efflux system